MNKIKFLAIFVFMALLTVTSCSEDNEAVNSYDENAIAKQLSFVDVDTRIANKQSKGTLSKVKIIIVSWDEWGRKKRNCAGWGLCNANWFPQFKKRVEQKNNTTNGAKTILEYDSNSGKYYIDILLA